MDVSSEMVYSLVPIFLSSVLHVDKAIIGLIEGIAEIDREPAQDGLRLAQRPAWPAQTA